MHENRHYVDWNYERHPVFAYSSVSAYDDLERLLNPNTYPSRPLVLTMARIVKHPLVVREGSSSILEDTLKSLQQTIRTELDKLNAASSVEFSVCWNLGNADFIILCRNVKRG